MQNTHGDGTSISVFAGYLCFVLVFIWNYYIFMFQLCSYEMCFVGLLMEVQHRQNVIFIWNMWFKIRPCVWHCLHGWGDGKWLRCSPHGWYLMNQGIVCQYLYSFWDLGIMKLSPLPNFIRNVLQIFTDWKTTLWG